MQKMLFFVLLVAATLRLEAAPIVLDGRNLGRTFEGVGALSAGASSRLLLDYPEPQRTEILDFLFKSNFGAALHHLKVEIGGDINSTDGTEPSHARTREELEHPRPEYFQRGYEWWLMREAKQRNPQIYLDALQWGAPGWIGEKVFDYSRNPGALTWEDRMHWNYKKYYTQDNADYIVGFLQGAKKHQGLDIDFCGVWNETAYDVPWIKLLRRTLDRNGLRGVKIVAADEPGKWNIADDLLKDPDLKKAVDIVGVHYSGSSTPAAKECGKPLWSSEDGPWRGDWAGACAIARTFNRNYLDGRMTKTIIWSLVSSYYENLPLPNSGLMKANTPWSGSYELQPALWAVAHTAQFTQPGWKYMDDACGLLAGGGSYVSLRSPKADGDYSIIIETTNAKKPQTFSFSPTGGLATGPAHVWRSDQKSQFDRQDDISPTAGSFSVVLEPGCFYSLTTTTGQHKGQTEIPPPSEFPLPYRDDFENGQPGKLPRYFSDQAGAFEVAERPGGGRCLRQTVAWQNIDWEGHPNSDPHSLIGSTAWRNYEVSCDAFVEQSGYVSLLGRILDSRLLPEPPRGYWLKVAADGRWELNACTKTLAAGTVPFAADRWHKLSLRFVGPKITVAIDGVKVKTIEDWIYFEGGMAGLGSGVNRALFDNFSVREVAGPPWINLALGKAGASSSNRKTARFATDGNIATFWQPADWEEAGCRLEVDFGRPTRFNRVRVRQAGVRIEKYKIQYHDGAEWQDAYSGVATEHCWSAGFPPVEASRVRLYVVSTRNDMPAVAEFEVYEE